MVGARGTFRTAASFTVTTLSNDAEIVDRLVLLGGSSSSRSLEVDRFRFTAETSFVVEIGRSPVLSLVTVAADLALFILDLVTFRCFFKIGPIVSSMADNSFTVDRIDRRVAGALGSRFCFTLVLLAVGIVDFAQVGLDSGF